MRCLIKGESSVSDNYTCMFVVFDQELLNGDYPTCSCKTSGVSYY